MKLSNSGSATTDGAAAQTSQPSPLTLERGCKIYGPDGRTGLCKTAWYDAIRAGAAPKPVRLGTRAVAWRSTDIDAFIVSRVNASDLSATPKGA